MAGINQLLPFANGDTANVIPFADWSGLSVRLTGFQSGIASSQQFNYILGQGGAAGYVIGQFVADFTTENATINATALYDSFKKAIAAFVPGNIADGSIGTNKIANGAITNAKLANDAVTSAKLADNSVGTEHIQANAVTADEIAAGAVGNSELANGAVTFPKIASAAIATQQQAEAGTATNVLMTPQRVKQAIDSAFESDLPMASATQLGGVKVTGDDGITINGSGEIAVDFSQMPTDKFEDLLKSIRVPIWLTKNKNFYVNPATGVDDADGGYGVTSEKPFKTLKYTLTYVTDTFNTSSYDIFINLASGYYDSNNTSSTSSTLRLPNFQGDGNIYIQNQNKDEKASTIIRYLINGERAVKYIFRNVTLQPVILSSANVNYNIIYAEKVSIDLFNVDFDFTYVEPAGNGTSPRAMINASSSSLIRVYASNAANFPSGITINYAGTAALVNTIVVNGGEFNMTADINITGSLNGGDGSVFAYANMLGVIRKSTSILIDPGRAPIINISPGVQVQGYRYRAYNNSIISTAGEGPGFFPGTVEGKTSTGAQYS